jgi:L-threonylcarbamoyladenylate synthase
MELREAAAVLRDGGTVAFPTETVYGLGANALDAEAVARVFEIKGRPSFDPLIVHVASIDQARQVVLEWPEQARLLAERLWPGPLTLVLPKAASIPDIVTAGLPTVAVRMPAHPVALELIAEAGIPVAAPSANRFGGISPTTADHVRAQLGASVDEIIDGGPCRVGLESTVLALAAGGPLLLRAGGTTTEEIEDVIGPVVRPGADPRRPVSPGQTARHYAPRTPLTLVEDWRDGPDAPRLALLVLRPPESRERFEAIEVLSPGGDLREAAANLFAALHRLDALGLDRIVAVRVPDQGLGVAINDRLRRAAHEEGTEP